MAHTGDLTLEAKRKIIIFSSGRGSNALNIVNYVNQFCHNLEVVCLMCNVEDAPVIQLMNTKNIPVEVVSSLGLKRDIHEKKVIETLSKYDVDWIVLAGYMRVLGEDLLNAYSNIINIHPSVLPLYPGLNSYKTSFENKDEYSGATIHFVDSGVDTGPIIMQKKFPRLKSDSFDQFRRRGLENEYELFRVFLSVLNKNETKVDDLIKNFSRSSTRVHTENRSITKEL